jgi:hypothetical protein
VAQRDLNKREGCQLPKTSGSILLKPRKEVKTMIGKIGTFLLATIAVFLLAGPVFAADMDDKSMKKDDSMMKDDKGMMKDETMKSDDTMKKDDTMMKDDKSMMKDDTMMKDDKMKGDEKNENKGMKY